MPLACLITSRLRTEAVLGLDRRAVMNQVFAGDDHLFRASKPLVISTRFSSRTPISTGTRCGFPSRTT